MEDKSYRVTVKVRNANLLRAIEKSGHEPGGKFCDLVGVPYLTLNDLINMKRSPIDKNGDIIPTVEKLCIFLNKMPSELFDFDQMHNPLETNSSEFDANIDDVLSISQDQDHFALKKLVSDKLDSLTEREGEILRLRYGIDGGEHTLMDIAKMQGVSSQRIRDIEAKGMRKLRHPTRSDELKEFMGS